MSENFKKGSTVHRDFLGGRVVFLRYIAIFKHSFHKNAQIHLACSIKKNLFTFLNFLKYFLHISKSYCERKKNRENKSKINVFLKTRFLEKLIIKP